MDRSSAYTLATSSLSKLRSTISEVFTPYAPGTGQMPRQALHSKLDPIVDVPLLVTNLGQEQSAEIVAVINDLSRAGTNARNSFGRVEAYEKPPYLAEPSGNPLDGWDGDGDPVLWTDINKALEARWLGPDYKAEYDKLKLLIRNPTLPDIQTPALARSASGFVTLRTKVRSDSTTEFYRLQMTEINRRETYRRKDIVRYCTYLLEIYAKDYLMRLYELGLGFDDLQRKFSLHFGDIYASLTDVLLTNAKMETGWFYNDYKSRLELWQSATNSNSDNYLMCLDTAIKSITAEANAKIEAAVSNLRNDLSKLMAAFNFQKLDAQHGVVLKKEEANKFSEELLALVSSSTSNLNRYANEYTNKLELYGSLSKAYSGLVASFASREINMPAS